MVFNCTRLMPSRHLSYLINNIRYSKIILFKYSADSNQTKAKNKEFEQEDFYSLINPVWFVGRLTGHGWYPLYLH